ncbi:zona pellucida sperm-binding protein 4-like [Heterodontus francisci]|uniref:zona pellucida sperm-binding protein 4-like n=1 Tax=Heterodontus francisci TaxID=7792 RepID=UPI00355C65B9
MYCGLALDGVDVVYETDVLAQFEILDGALGSVSRDSPFRLHVQCSYKGSQESELQLKPRVYTLSPPLPATETRILLLELRIARDAAYRSWYVASDYPILSVLREPVFVEVRVLNRNDPSLVLVLNECWASPTAEPYSQLQWKLLVNRCPFTGDNYKSRLLPLDAASHLRFPTHHKRFVVSTFTFWERVSGRPLSGEVYFHCSAEVCSPSSRENCTASCSPKRRRSTNDQSGTLVTTGPIIFLEDGERLSAGIQQEEKDAAVDSPSHVLPGVAVGVALLSVVLLVGTVAVWKMDVGHRLVSSGSDLFYQCDYWRSYCLLLQSDHSPGIDQISLLANYGQLLQLPFQAFGHTNYTQYKAPGYNSNTNCFAKSFILTLMKWLKSPGNVFSFPRKVTTTETFHSKLEKWQALSKLQEQTESGWFVFLRKFSPTVFSTIVNIPTSCPNLNQQFHKRRAS